MNVTGRAAGAGMMAALVVAVGPSVAQAFEISVRGEARLETDVRAAGTTVGAGGRLVDDLGEPVPRQSVDVAVYRGERQIDVEAAETDYFGRFSTVFELEPGDYDVQFDYGGASHVSGVHTAESLEVEEAPAELTVDTPAWVQGASPEVGAEIRASADGVGIPTFVTVAVDDRPAASVDLDREGRAELDVGPYLEAGDNEVAVVLEETEYREAVTASTAIRQSVEPRLEGRLERVFERTDRGRALEVDLRDEQGPLAGVDVEFQLIPVGEQTERKEGYRAIDETGQQGEAAAMFADDELAEGRFEPRAIVEPAAGDAVEWRGEPFEQTEPGWPPIVRTVALVVLGAGLVWVGRRRLVAARNWIAGRLWNRTDDRESEPDRDRRVLEEVQQLEVRHIDTSVAEESDESTSLVVQVWDEWRDEPVESATIELEDRDGREDGYWQTNRDGLVELPATGETVKLGVEAPGFVPVRGSIRVGDVEGPVRVEMTPVPLQIRRAYRWMVEQTRGDDPWGRLTPRQIEEALRELEDIDGDRDVGGEVEARDWREVLEFRDGLDEDQRAERLVETVTAIVEETNFSGRHFEVSIWEQTRRLLEQLARQLEVDGGEGR